jgi:ubiquinone/menaquinone biosynthesis C-methylase UbiE
MEEEKLEKIASQLRKPEGEEGIKTGVSMNQGNRFMNLQAIQLLDAKAGDSILEIGMGNGLFVKEILQKDPTIRYTGFDHSPLMVSEAKKINDDWIAKGAADFVLGEVSSLPFAPGSFNKIITINTIYFWKDHAAVFRELKRVLKRGGMLLIAIRPKHQMQNYPFTKYGFMMFSDADMKELLMANGFGVRNVYHNAEPDYDFNGSLLKMENVVIMAEAI